MKRVRFAAPVWEDYLHLQHTDSALSKRLDQLIAACSTTPFDGIGCPRALAAPLQGWWSRRVTLTHRLVYRVVGEEI